MIKTSDLEKAYEFDCNVMPPFIDMRRKEHEDAWFVVSNHMEVMSKLFIPRFVSKKQIRFLAEQLYLIFEEMQSINANLALLYHNWVFTILDYYIEKAEGVECYEVCHNIHTFIQLYTQNEPI